MATGHRHRRRGPAPAGYGHRRPHHRHADRTQPGADSGARWLGSTRRLPRRRRRGSPPACCATVQRIPRPCRRAYLTISLGFGLGGTGCQSEVLNDARSSSIRATIRIGPARWGHINTSIAHVRLSSSAQRSRRSLLGSLGPSGPGGAGGTGTAESLIAIVQNAAPDSAAEICARRGRAMRKTSP